MPDIPLLGQAAARQRAVAEQTEAELGPQIIEATTAFIVAWVNGAVMIYPDLDTPVSVHHQPTADEIHGAASVVAKDRAAEETAQTTVMMIAQQQAIAMQRLQNAQLEAEAAKALEAEKKAQARR